MAQNVSSIHNSDYNRIAEAISFITSRVDGQPTLQEIAGHLHLSPYHFQRLFCRWTGVTPKRFLQALTLERAYLPAHAALVSLQLQRQDIADLLWVDVLAEYYNRFPSAHDKIIDYVRDNHLEQYWANALDNRKRR